MLTHKPQKLTSVEGAQLKVDMKIIVSCRDGFENLHNDVGEAAWLGDGCADEWARN